MVETLRERLDAPLSFWRRFTDAGPGVLAAAIAYNLFFALVPTAVAIVSAASFFGRSEEAIRRTEDALRAVAPEQLAELVSRDILPSVAARIEGSQTLVITISLLVSLWLASRAVVTIQRGLARIEELDEHRSWWRQRAVGVALTLGAGGAFLFSAVLLVAGDAVASWLDAWVESETVSSIWNALSVPIGLVGLLLFLAALYRWGPPEPLPRLWAAAFGATVGIAAASFGFRVYLSQAGDLGTLAVVGAFAVLLLWLYLVAMAIIVAASTSAAAARRPRRGAHRPSGPGGADQ